MSPVPDDSDVPPVLPTGPPDAGLAAELALAAPRRWWDKGTLLLSAAALLLGGFLGGLQVQKHSGSAETARPGGAQGTRAAGGYGNIGGGTGGFPGAGATPRATAAGAAGPTTGKVKLVDGSTIYVETADGTVVTVRTSGDTAVQTATPGQLKDVKAGDTISVQGGADTEGTVTATTVTTSEAG